MKNLIILDKIEPCPKCNELMERRKHSKIGQKQLNKTYYFSEWDYCRDCNHVQFYEKFKVYSKPYKEMMTLFEEQEEKDSFLRNI